LRKEILDYFGDNLGSGLQTDFICWYQCSWTYCNSKCYWNFKL